VANNLLQEEEEVANDLQQEE